MRRGRTQPVDQLILLRAGLAGGQQRFGNDIDRFARLYEGSAKAVAGGHAPCGWVWVRKSDNRNTIVR